MDNRNFEISWTSLWRILFFLIFVIVLFMGRKIFLGLFLAIVISSGLDFMVDFLERRGLPRTLGVILIFLLCLSLVIITVYAIVPLVIIDLNTVLVGLNSIADQTWFGPLVNFKSAQSFTAFVSRISTQFFANGNSPIGAFSDIVGGLVLGFSIFISSFYLSLSRDGVERFIRSVFPPSHEGAALRIYARARKRIGTWFRTQLFLSLTMAVLVIITLMALKVRYAFFLGILAGIFELVPFVGPILSGAAATLSALGTSPTLALYTLIASVILHQFENHVLVPLLMGRSVGLHPVIVIVALLIGAEVGGVLGILISVPAAVVFQEILEDWTGRTKARELSFD